MSREQDLVRAVLSAFEPEARRPQTLDPQKLVDGIQDRFDRLFLSDIEVRDRGDSLLFSFVPDPQDFEVVESGRSRQRAFASEDKAYIQGRMQSDLEDFASKRGHYVALYQLEDAVSRFKAKDVPSRKVAPEAAKTQVLWVDLQYGVVGFFDLFDRDLAISSRISMVVVSK